MGFMSKTAALLTKIADMIIVSLYFILCCVPLVTLVPSCCALYQTASKVLRRDVGNLTQEFFKTLKMNLRQGIPLSLIYLLLFHHAFRNEAVL